MKQTAPHSNTPEFGVNKSATGRLYQHPTPANTVQYKSKSGLVFPSVIAILVCSIGLMSSCSHSQAQDVSFAKEEANQ